MTVDVGQGTWAGAESRRARNVWLVLVLCTLAFVSICAFSGLALSSYVGQWTTTQPATLEVRQGVQISVKPHGTRAWQLVAKNAQLGEGDEVQSASESSAFLKLFDGSTLWVYGDTHLTLSRLRTSQFSHDEKAVEIRLNDGIVVLGTAGSDQFSRARYTIVTTHAEIEVGSNSRVRVRVGSAGARLGGPVLDAADATQVAVDYGSVRLVAPGRTIEIPPGMMIFAASGGVIGGPLDIAEEIVRNGSFIEPPTNPNEEVDNGGVGTAAWLPIRLNVQQNPSPEGSAALDQLTLSDQRPPTLPNARSILMSRHGEGAHYIQLGVRQDINMPVEFFGTLTLNAVVRVQQQAAQVGGPQGDLFPLTIRVIYSDANAQRHEWKHSFYYGGDAAGLEDGVTKVQQGKWTTLQQLAAGDPDRFVLKSAEKGQDMVIVNAVEVYGYGEQFESLVTGISLVGR